MFWDQFPQLFPGETFISLGFPEMAVVTTLPEVAFLPILHVHFWLGHMKGCSTVGNSAGMSKSKAVSTSWEMGRIRGTSHYCKWKFL